MPRRKYNPDGSNEYSAPQIKPPRHDLRRKHRIIDDPLDKKDRNQKDEEIMRNSDEHLKIETDNEKELAKKIARKKIRTAGEIKHIKDTSGFDAGRENLENFKFNTSGQKSVANTYKHLAKAFSHMVQASNTFNKLKSSQISPDGKIGGKGFVQSIKAVRVSFSDTINVLSELIDSFYDEVNSPYWKKQTYEENPEIVALIDEADKIIDNAEEIKETAPKIVDTSVLAPIKS